MGLIEHIKIHYESLVTPGTEGNQTVGPAGDHSWLGRRGRKRGEEVPVEVGRRRGRENMARSTQVLSLRHPPSNTWTEHST